MDAASVDDDQVTPTRASKPTSVPVHRLPGHVFRLEKQFRITIHLRELFPGPFSRATPPTSPAEGDSVGLAALEKQMPYADLAEFKKDPRMDKVEDLFTVDLLVRYLAMRMAAK